MYNAWDNARVDRFWMKRVSNGKFDEGHSKGKMSEVNYTFLDNGFHDVLLYPLLPLMVIGVLLYPYCSYLIFFQVKSETMAWFVFLGLYIGVGQSCGAHRLWCHRSYKASFPLRLFLAIGFTIGGQFSLYTWARGHRIHHKYSDTHADPHNVNRGIVFSHGGFFLKKEHPICEMKAKEIDTSDLLADPIVAFLNDHFFSCFAVLTVILPVAVPMIAWGETFECAVLVPLIFQSFAHHNNSGFVNSATHMFGLKPYNPKIRASEIWLVAALAFGEGYHNYHHQYPNDYAISEDGMVFNIGRYFIDLMAFFGLAYDLKRASPEAVEKCKSNVSLSHKLTYG